MNLIQTDDDDDSGKHVGWLDQLHKSLVGAIPFLPRLPAGVALDEQCCTVSARLCRRDCLPSAVPPLIATRRVLTRGIIVAK